MFLGNIQKKYKNYTFFKLNYLQFYESNVYIIYKKLGEYILDTVIVLEKKS